MLTGFLLKEMFSFSVLHQCASMWKLTKGKDSYSYKNAKQPFDAAAIIDRAEENA